MNSTASKLHLTAKQRRRKSATATESGKHSGRGSSKSSKRHGGKKKRAWEPRINPELLRSLLLSDLGVSPEQPLTSDLSLEKVERIMLARSLLKKYQGVENEDAEHLAIQDFLSRNRACDGFSIKASTDIEMQIDGLVKETIHKALFPHWDSSFGLAEISVGFNVGPGASTACEEKDFLTKVFHSGLACTHQDLHLFYRHAIRGSTWGAAEERRHQRYGLTVVRGGRLGTVLKERRIRRTILTEPPLNMMFQKGIGAIFEAALKATFGIDLSKQPEINQILARIGSCDQSIGTIDLKSASNSVSVGLCKSHFPATVFGWMMLARSPIAILPDGSEEKLSMMSSMGNAFTFPLQTLIFASIVTSCYRMLGIKPERCDSDPRGVPSNERREAIPIPNWGVFGDDILVLREAYELVCQTLSRYGFTVNEDKSFNSGGFRESCGGDFWCGYLVRGIYIERLLSEADLYSTINRLVRWSARSGVCLDLTMWYLMSRLDKRKPLYIPFSEGDTGGIKAAFDQVGESHAKIDANGSYWYKALRPKARSYAAPPGPDDWAIEKGHRRIYDGDSIFVALVGGYIRDGNVSLPYNQGDIVPHKVRTVISINWDHLPPAEASQLRGGLWKETAAYYLNLLSSRGT